MAAGSTPTLALISIQRPLFRGDKEAAFQRSLDELKPLCEAEGVELAVYPRPVDDGATAVKAAAWLDALEPHFALVQMTTFATGEMLEPLADACSRLGVWAIPEDSREGPLPLNSLCGANMYLNILARSRRGGDAQGKWFYGYPSDPLFVGRFRATAAALRGLAALQGAVIGLVGGVAPAFYGLECDLDAVSRRFGCSFEEVQLDEFFELARGLSDADIMPAACHMADDAAQCSLTPEQTSKAARIETALRRLLDDRGWAAMGLRCWPEIPDTLGSMPCAAVGRIMGERAPIACEGDPLGAVCLLALQAISRARPMMMDLSDWDREDDTVLMWHCGNTPKEWADERGDSLTPHFNRPHMGAVRQLVFRPGPATVFRLVDDAAAGMTFTGSFCQPDKPGFDGARGWMGDISMGGAKLDTLAFAHTLLEHGMPHHFPMAPGEWEDACREFAFWSGVRLLGPLPYSDARTPPAD